MNTREFDYTADRFDANAKTQMATLRWHTVEYNAFSDPSSDDIGDCPARYGRIGIEFETWWEVRDYDRQGHYVGHTREEAVINALNGGFRA